MTGIKIEAGQDSTKNSKYSIDDILNQAEQSIEEYNYEMAQKFLERALEINSDHPRALEMTASLLLEVRNSFDFKIFGLLLVQKCSKTFRIDDTDRVKRNRIENKIWDQFFWYPIADFSPLKNPFLIRLPNLDVLFGYPFDSSIDSYLKVIHI